MPTSSLIGSSVLLTSTEIVIKPGFFCLSCLTKSMRETHEAKMKEKETFSLCSFRTKVLYCCHFLLDILFFVSLLINDFRDKKTADHHHLR